MHTLTTLVASLPTGHDRRRATETVRAGVLLVAPLLVGLPLLSAAVLLLGGPALGPVGALARRAARRRPSFVVAAIVFVDDAPAARRTRASSTCTWAPGSTRAPSSSTPGMRLDPLSMTFVLLVTFVGTLIHIYAVAYMDHDVDRRRFFAYLNLFVAAMLVLVLADSYLLLFVGWEGVGLASYLLIGFWNYNTEYAVAAKKAFVANRIGDLGLIIALGLMFATFGAVGLRRPCSAAPTAAPARARSRRSGSCCCWPPAASRRSSRCSPGSATRWPARRRCPRSSTPPPWSPPAST